MSHILPSIRCRCDNAFSCDSYSANLTKPKPFDCFVRMSLLTCKQRLLPIIKMTQTNCHAH